MSDNPVYERVIHKSLERKVEEFGNRPFLYFQDQVYGYRDFDQSAGRVACGLQNLGIGKGDRIAIIMDNSPEFLFLWFGLSKLGAVEVPVNTAQKGDMLAYIINQAECTAVVVDERYYERLAPVLPKTPLVKDIVVNGNTVVPPPRMHLTRWVDLVSNDGKYEQGEVKWSDPFVILFTSGTTGPSKGVVLPQNYGLFMADLTRQAGRYTQADRLYNALPLFHGNAQVLSTLPALVSGAGLVLAKRFSASRFWNDIRQYGCTEFNYIGGIIPILYKAEPKPDDDNNPLRIMLGAGVPKDIFKPFEKRFGVTLLENYGMTEIGAPLMSTSYARKEGSCGRQHEDYQLRVVDDEGLEVGPVTPGELLVRPLKPNSMMLEYYNMPDKTVEAWKELWFHTGDYLYYDEEGFYFFVDRKKDALRRRGENISSFEVEKVINSHPAVMESAAIAVSSELGEDELMVCLSVKPGKSISPEELVHFCSDRMAYFMVPRYIRLMDSLPKTPTERVRKFHLRETGVTPDTWDMEKSGISVKR